MKIFLLDDEESFGTDLIDWCTEVKTISGKNVILELIAKVDLKSAREYLFKQNNNTGRFPEINLFFIDYYLDKGESGISIISEIRKCEEYNKTPIVLLTGYDSTKIAFEAGELGATMFSLKEDLISPENLQLLIEEVMKKNEKRKAN